MYSSCVSPSPGWFLSYYTDQGGLYLNRDERASLAAKAKDGLQLIHEVNGLLCWKVVHAFIVTGSSSHRLR